jgi:hypothetical protein
MHEMTMKMMKSYSGGGEFFTSNIHRNNWQVLNKSNITTGVYCFGYTADTSLSYMSTFNRDVNFLVETFAAPML